MHLHHPVFQKADEIECPWNGDRCIEKDPRNGTISFGSNTRFPSQRRNSLEMGMIVCMILLLEFGLLTTYEDLH
jgi:hypothetical protein